MRAINAGHPEVEAEYPFKCTDHFNSLIRGKNDPLYRQVMPSGMELSGPGLRDPLAEERFMPVPGLVRRYPDRSLLLPTFECFAYCRFCTRKRKWGKQSGFFDHLDRVFGYIASDKKIREAIVSGGDPLTLPDTKLELIVSRLARIKHVRVLRIATRCLTFEPSRVTAKTAAILARHPMVYFTTHFNHPGEITALSEKKCSLLRAVGINLINQSVLLKGVNDDLKTLMSLNRRLLENGIKPYALHQLDFTASVQHFKVSVQKGLKLIRDMRKNFTGIGIPHYVLDQPGGKGKIFPGYRRAR